MSILVGYIPSPAGEAALSKAMVQAQVRGDELVVLNVSPEDAVVDERRVYDDQVDELRARLEAAGVRYVLRRSTRRQPAGDEILQVADEVGADLLVIGLRRRSATGKLLFGSTAQRVLLGADCDVLAVKAPRR